MIFIKKVYNCTESRRNDIAIFTEENILNLLYAYNLWWKTGVIHREFNKPFKRVLFYDAEKAFGNEIRRTGKTTIIYQMISKLLKEGISPKNILFISFDHPLLKMCSIDNVLNIYSSYISSDNEVYCFFDEIQYSDNWNSWLKILYDTSPNIKIMATGSASPILEDKARESGLGRWVTIQVPTLSFYEFCQLLGIINPELSKNIKPTQLYALSQQE